MLGPTGHQGDADRNHPEAHLTPAKTAVVKMNATLYFIFPQSL